MPLLDAFRALAVSGPLASRAFLPLLVLAAVARWPESVAWIPFCPDPPIALPAGLAWLASDVALATLALLAALEVLADKQPEAREILDAVGPALRSGIAVLAALAILDPQTTSALRALTAESASDTPSSPIAFVASPEGGASPLAAAWPVALALAAGALTWVLARWRASLLEPVRDAADDLGLSRLASWAEDAWSLGGTLLLIVSPVLAVLAALLLGGVLWIAQRAAEKRSEARRVACPSCATRARPEALACPTCGTALAPQAEPSSPLWPDRWPEVVTGSSATVHALDLIGRGRCPRCAETRPVVEVLSGMPHACGLGDTDPLEIAAGMRELGRRRALRLVVPALLLGLVPILGPAAALVIARLRVAAPMRRFLPWSARWKARWTARIVSLVLLVGSALPFASALVAVLLVATQEWTWGRALDRHFGRAGDAVTRPARA